MRKRYLFVVGLILSGAGTRSAQAITGDPFNLLAPAVFDNGTVNEYVYARKSDGTIWVKETEGTIGPWTSIGSPPGGASSGPQVGQLCFFGSPTQTWVVASSGGNIWAKEGSGAWTNALGAPPGGITSGPAVSWNSNNCDMHVVVNGVNNIPWIITIQAPIPGGGTPIISSWSQVGTTPVNSAPSVAETSWRQDVVALDGNNHIIMTTCEYPSCFGSWTEVEGSGIGSSAPMAYWFNDAGSATDGPFLAIAVRGILIGGNFNAWVNTYDNLYDTWTGWQQRGGNLDSAIAPTHYVLESGNNTWLAAFDSHGDYWENTSQPSATSWYDISHP